MSVPPSLDVDALSTAELKRLVLELLSKVAELERRVSEQQAEIPRLKGLKGKPAIKPSGMEPAAAGAAPSRDAKRRRRGKAAKTAERVAREDRIVPVAAVPAGSCFKGYQDYAVQELELCPRVIRFRRERWLIPDGRTVIAPLPPGITGHIGPELQRFLLLQYHQGQTTVARLAAVLRTLGLDVSQRQIVRLLTAPRAPFVAEAQAVLRAGFATARWVSVDDTSARHKSRNEVCTQIGDDRFTFFATTASKSRLNFLDLLRAGHRDYVINAAALGYMRQRALPAHAIARLAQQPDQRFANEGAWQHH